MEQTLTNNPIRQGMRNGRSASKLAGRMIKNRWLFIMMLPGVIYYIAFKYVPLWGILVAFKDYKPFLGFIGSDWVGFKHFQRFFTEPTFWMLFKNTMIIAGLNLVFFFPIPIIAALMLNELRNALFKRVIQTLVYIPHFISWVIVVGICYIMFTTEGGVINDLIYSWTGNKINFLLSAAWFRPMIVGQIIWKETGWGTIVFLAALAGIDVQLYEAARIDGANRMKQLWYITLPGIRSTIVILLILRLGHFLDTGFDQIYNMMNAMNTQVAEVFDTYVYRAGITQGQFSYSTAVGLFKSVVGLILVVLSNKLSKKFGEEGVY